MIRIHNVVVVKMFSQLCSKVTFFSKSCSRQILFIALLFYGAILNAQSQMDVSKDSIRLDAFVEVLIDKDDQYTLNDILTSEVSNQFRSSNTSSLNFGFIKSAYWFKIILEPEVAKDRLLEVGFPLLDIVELYIPDGVGGYTVKKSGDHFPFANREVRSSTFVFSLPDSTKTSTYYLHVQSEGGATQVPLTLWRERAFYDYLANKRTWLGLYYGILLVMGIYNLFLFLFIRDKNYLYYTLYITMFSLLQLSLDGIGYEYLWPENTWLGSYAATVFLSLSSLSIFLFSRNFLATKKFTPVIDRVFQIFIAICLISLLISLFYDFSVGTQFSTFIGLVLSLLILTTGLKIFLQGYRPARYFLLAWAGFMVGIGVNVLLYYGFVPINFLTSNAMRVGSMLEVILFSLAIADRLLILQKENEKVEQRARQYLSDLNLDLENMVQERTMELSEANQKLEEMNARLEKLALMDDLTELINHRTFIDRLILNLEEAYRYKYPISVVMLDLDYFKMVNDSYGHQAGDEILIEVAKTIKSTLRSSDLGARYGGEEFVLMLSHTSIEDARLAAERLHELIRAIDIKGMSGLKVTASFGVSAIVPDAKPIDDKELIRRADNALYQAKASGRDRVMVYESTDMASYNELPV